MNKIKQYNISNENLYTLILSKRFLKILNKIDDVVSNELLKLYKNRKLVKETFIDITQKEDVVTFLGSDKVNKMIQEDMDLSECWGSRFRMEVKIGRLIYRLLAESVNSSDIESFVNEYKSILKEKESLRNFQIVEGEEIKKWYLQDNYEYYPDKKGKLGNSCMRHRYCKNFFNIYSKNPEKIKMLILLSDNRKLLGRALLWKLDRPKDVVFMDTIYYSDDHVLNLFNNYALKKDWYYRSDNENYQEILFKGEKLKLAMAVNIKKLKYTNYPFVDTLGFYYYKRGILSNSVKLLKILGCEEYYDLCNTDGGYEIRKDFDF